MPDDIRIDVIPVGTTVSVNGVTATVIGILLRNPDPVIVTYEVEWWAGREVQSAYFYPFQVEAIGRGTTRIGFARPATGSRKEGE